MIACMAAWEFVSGVYMSGIVNVATYHDQPGQLPTSPYPHPFAFIGSCRIVQIWRFRLTLCGYMIDAFHPLLSEIGRGIPDEPNDIDWIGSVEKGEVIGKRGWRYRCCWWCHRWLRV